MSTTQPHQNAPTNDTGGTAENRSGSVVEETRQMGGVSVTTFKEERTGQWGNYVHRTVTIRRRYTDDEGQTQWASGSLRPEQLPIACLLLSQVADRLVGIRNGSATGPRTAESSDSELPVAVGEE